MNTVEKQKIEDYEMIADGAGIITHWKSTDPKEDRLMRGIWVLLLF